MSVVAETCYKLKMHHINNITVTALNGFYASINVYFFVNFNLRQIYYVYKYILFY